MIRVRKNENGKNRYQAIVRVKGFPPKTKTCKDKKSALKWEMQTKIAMEEGRYYSDTQAKKQTLSDAIERYKTTSISPTTKNYKTIIGQLRWWDSEYGKYSLAQLSSDLICRARDNLLNTVPKKGRKRSPSTVNRYLATLSVVLSTACNEWGWIHESPLPRVRKLKEPRGRVRFLDDQEREKLLRACKESANPHLFPIVVLALSTGMRKGEILNLKWTDIDLESGTAILNETKNGERRIVPIVGYALETMKEHAITYCLGNTFAFPSKNGSAPVAIKFSWEHAVKNSFLMDFRFHDLRHSAASYLAMNKATPSEIAEVLGHKILVMVKRYAHLSDPHTRSVVSKMNDAIFERHG